MQSLAGLGANCVGSTDPACTDMDAAWDRLLEKAGDLVLCHDDKTVPFYERVVGDDGTVAYYDRAGRCVYFLQVIETVLLLDTM